MEIFDDPNNIQKRFEGKICGERGMGYAEIFPNKKMEKFIKKIESYVLFICSKKHKRL